MKNLRLIFKLTISALLISGASLSQVSDISFDQIFLEDGLSQSIVKSIAQDKHGFMYFGTEDGLNLYDAYSFTVLRNSDNPNSLSYNDITSLCEDKFGRLWIGTFNSGLNLYIPEKKKFIRFSYDSKNPNSLSNNNINTIIEDDKFIWVGTDFGLNQIVNHSSDTNDFKVKRGIKDLSNNQLLDNIRIISLFKDKKDNLWVGTNLGLYKISLKNSKIFKINIYKNNSEDLKSLSDNSVRSIYEDSEENLWIGTDNGLNKISLSEREKENPNFIKYQNSPTNPKSISNNEVYAIAEDKSGKIWIGTNVGGISIYNSQKNNFDRYLHDPLDSRSLSSNAIRSLYLDQSGIMWIGTYGSGINKVSRGTGQFYHYKHRQNDLNTLSHSIIWSFYEDENEILWIGTHNGLDKLDRKLNLYKHYQFNTNENSIGHNVIRVVTPMNNGKLLIGTNGGGLDVFDPKTNLFENWKHNPNDSNSLNHDQLRDIYQDKEGIIWIGTYGRGMDRFDPYNGSFKHYLNIPDDSTSISHNYVRVIVEDKNGFLWIGTEGGGLNKFNKNTEKFTHYNAKPRQPNSLTSDYIFSIYIDSSKYLWLGTYGGGLNKFNKLTTECEVFNIVDGLPSSSIYGMIKDFNGIFWISTNNGISKFNPTEKSFKNYNVKDGLQNNEFNGGSYYKSKSGEFFFGGINGFNAFQANNIEDNNYLPPIVLTSFKIFNEEIYFPEPLTSIEEIELTYSDNVFSIDFAALDYSAPEKNKYAYKLEGVDKDWVYVNADKRTASYTTLSPGNYNFYVKGSNSDGLWNDEETLLTIKIIPPFWQRLWFLALVALILLGLAYMLYLRRLRIIRMKVELQTAHDAQLSIMPESDPENDHLEISGTCLPAFEVGGDFFDYFWLDKNKSKYAIVIGDVSGKAMKAAITAIMTSGMIISESKENHNISRIIRNVNESILSKIEKKMFISLCVCSIDVNHKKLSLANAGMTKPILVTNGTVKFLDSEGPRLPIGIVENVNYEEALYELKSGDLLILTTDGITEAQNSKRVLFSENRLKEHLLKLNINNCTAAEIKNSIIQEVENFTKSEKQSDDLTVVVIRIK